MKLEPRYKPGDRIGGRYQVDKALLGGMGEVYLCLDLEEELPYALKTFQQRYLTDTHRLRRAFEQEVATWIALEKHPNIVRCFMMQTLDRQPFMMLEWIAGEEGKGTDLRSWLRHGPLDLQLALQIAIDICNGLLHAQTKRPGLVHRDLKPENILMAQGGLAKLTDFGLAQIAQTAGLAMAGESFSDAGRQSMIGSKGIAGTPAYMAPEQWREEEMDTRTDIYAMGCILYEMVTGTVPFVVTVPATTPDRAAVWLRSMQQAHEEIAIAPLPSTLPGALNTVVQQCLAKRRTARYANVAELLTGLTALYQTQFDQPPVVRPSSGAFTAADYSNRGATYDVIGKREAALADYTCAIQLEPNDTKPYNNRGVTYLALQDYEAAMADYNHAIELDPNNAKAYNNRGVLHRRLRDYDAALTDLTRTLELDPNDAIAYFNRGIIYTDMQENGAALTDFTRAIELGSKDPNAYINRGVMYVDLQDYRAALIDFTYAIELDSNNTTAYSNRGSAYHALRNYEAALADFTYVLTLDATNAKTYNKRGATYAALKDHTALADFTQAIALASNYANAYYNRGVMYAEMRAHESALTDFTQAIKLDPTGANAYYNRGNTYANIQNFESALADFTQAIELDPNYISAYHNRGNTYAALGKREAARADYSHVLTLDPCNANAYIGRGVLYATLEDHTAALADFTQALTIDPTNAKVYYNRGLTNEALGDYAAALADFTRTLNLDPTDATAYHNRGLIYATLQDQAAALTDYVRASELAPTDAKIYVNIGVLFANQGQLAEALPYFEKAAQLDHPQGKQYADQARQRLGLDPAHPLTPTKQAFGAFQQADSLAAMQQAVTRYPLLLQPNFITIIEQTITQTPPEHRPAFTQRLTWLRQVANTQPRSTP